MTNTFKCYVIGDDSLTAKCCDLIVQNKNEVMGVLSSNLQAVEWAADNKVPLFKSFIEFEQAITSSDFEYLFSISNKKILPDNIINAPSKFAINYHNAPLPKYGGCYATSWAIMNREHHHGITWHVMTSEVDGGDILEQAKFPILTDDTMITLNTRCHEYAAKLFEKLLHKISINKVKISKQTSVVEYYPLNKKAKHDGLIIWNNTVEEIYALFRALSSYPALNHIGLPKILLGNEIFIPKGLKILSKTSKKYHSGTIVNFADDFIEVTTKTKNIKITKIANMDGTEYSIRKLIDICNIKKEQQLVIPPEKFANKLEEYANNNFKHESYWVKKFKNLSQPLDLPCLSYVTNYNKRKNKSISCSYDFRNVLKLKFLSKICDDYKTDHFVYTLFLVYMYRINNYESFSIGYSSDIIEKIAEDSKNIYAGILPCDINFDMGVKNIVAVFKAVQYELLEIENRKTYNRDIFQRYPSINNNQVDFSLVITNQQNYKNISPQPQTIFVVFKKETSELVFTANEHHLLIGDFKKITSVIVNHIKTWLKEIMANPDMPVVNLPILTAKENRRVFNRWHGEKVDYSRTMYISKAIEKYAANKSNETALISDNGPLSYGELNKRVDCLANHLSKNKVMPEDVVAVSLEDNILFIISILAVMKTGAVYLPMDPAYPDNNLNFMLSDSKAKILITSDNVRNRLINQSSNILCIDKDFIFDDDKKHRSSNRVKKNSLNDIAYIVYTSGSTGNPKGVMVSRKNIMNSLRTRVDYYVQKTKIKSASINLLLLLSTSFDTAMAAIFWPLLCGSKLTVLNSFDVKDVTKIIQVIKQNKITHIICVPSLYEKILDQANKDDLCSLRLVIIGGDQWGSKLIDVHELKVPKSYLFNEYGVTEVTIWSTTKKIYDPKTKKKSDITVGWPIPNAKIFIFDKYMQIVPKGVLGELFLGGNSVTCGYLNRPDLTKDRFIRYKDISGKTHRLYKTGDLCRYSDSGLAFQGRIDNQVKIRGFRVELQQIEKMIIQYDNVKQCVITDRTINKEKHLIAYIIIKNPHIKFNKKNLICYLSENLPNYMVPSFFVLMSDFPLTNNNKIDRNKLPLPNIRDKVTNKETFVKPKNFTEIQLVELWKKILRLDEVSIDDSFFDLGGHSLLITELLISIKKQFNVEIKMQSFFEYPTIEKLALIVDNVSLDSNTRNSFVKKFLRDSFLGQKIHQSSNMPLKTKPEAILLTGVTGFFGSYLLQDLYYQTTATIYCLIRATSNSEAQNRLQKCILDNSLDLDLSKTNRIKVIASDLSLPLLGLSQKKFNYLSDIIDLIYHNGAHVHHLYNYDLLRAANVYSTQEILKLLKRGKSKKIHYISTLSAAIEKNSDNKIKENFPKIYTVQELSTIDNGYLQTKMASECLLAQAKDCGAHVNIYRPTWILWHSKTGKCSIQHNHLLHLIRGCMQIGYAPAWNMTLNVWPVDILSKYLVQMSLFDQNKSRVFNFQNTNIISWKKLMNWINLNCCKVQLVKSDEWIKKHLVNIKQDNALFPLLSLYLNNNSMADKMPNMTPNDIEDTNVRSYLKKLDLKYPEIDDTFLKNGHLT